MATLKEIRDKVTTYLLDVVPETNALIDDFINDGVRQIERRHNFREMEAVVDLATTANDRTLASLPARFKQRRDPPFVIGDDGATWEIAWAPSWSAMVQRYNNDSDVDTGSPKFILEHGGELFVYPYPDGESDWVDGEYRIRLPFWRYSERLVNESDTNYLTDRGDLYLLYYAVTEGFLLNQDERQAAIYQGRANGEMKSIINADKRSRLPRNLNLKVRSDVYGPGKGPNRGRL